MQEYYRIDFFNYEKKRSLELINDFLKYIEPYSLEIEENIDISKLINKSIELHIFSYALFLIWA